MKKSITLIFLVIVIVAVAALILTKITRQNFALKEKECFSSCYIFIEDFSVRQAVYSGGDFPSGTKVTHYKKGQIIQGREGLDGCQGEGCVPEKIIIVNVNGQNWPVSKSILVPYK